MSFDHIAKALSRAKACPFTRCAAPAGSTTQKGASKTSKLLYALRDGPKTGAQLATIADLESTGLVGALLKHARSRGQVNFWGGHWSLNPDFDADLRAELDAAVAMLRRAGYKISPPATT